MTAVWEFISSYRTPIPIRRPARADILYQISSRWQAHANDRYSYSADPFGSYFTIVGQPSPNNPNPNVYVPFATTQSEYWLSWIYRTN